MNLRLSLASFGFSAFLLVTCAAQGELVRPPEFTPDHASDAPYTKAKPKRKSGLHFPGLHLSTRYQSDATPTPTPSTEDTDTSDEDDKEPSLDQIFGDGEKTATDEGKRILEMGKNMLLTDRIVVGTCWDYIYAVYKNAGFTDRNVVTPFAGKKAGPYADPALIQPGDWLYFINHSYGDGEHSGIFISWLDYSTKDALILSYRGENSVVPGRYSSYELSSVYNIMRPKAGILTKLGPPKYFPLIPFKLNPPPRYQMGVENLTVGPDGFIYAIHSADGNIEVFDPNGKWISEFGSKGQGPGQLWYPNSIVFDESGNIYVNDEGNERIVEFDIHGKALQNFPSVYQKSLGGVRFASRLTRDSKGNFYIVNDTAIVVLDASGKFLRNFGTVGDGEGQFNNVTGITVGANGNIFLVDNGHSRVSEYTPEGNYVSSFGSEGQGPGQFLEAREVTADKSGNLYVTDRQRIQKFDPQGKLLLEIKSQNLPNYRKSLTEPTGLAVDAAGNIYVADSTLNRIFKYSPEGVLLTP